VLIFKLKDPVQRVQTGTAAITYEGNIAGTSATINPCTPM